ncbi:MAG: DNA repair protein RecO [Desulfuromonadaceae bacterium]|nr:DNA repair protein RecO [Desulfuromonadaceae bacterium]
MVRPVIDCSEALVVRYTNYGESDRVVTLLTAEQGLISGFAPGARNSRRRFGPALQLFSHIQIYWQRGNRGGLRQLREAELLAPAERVMANLEAWALAAYGCELAVHLFPEEQPLPEIFRLLRDYLNALSPGENLAETRLLYELRLLDRSGLLPHLGHCARCWRGLPDSQVGFDAAGGGALCPDCGGLAAPLRVSALSLGSLSRLLRLDRGCFGGVRLSARTLDEGRSVLGQILEEVLARPLRSEPFIALFRDLV